MIKVYELGDLKINCCSDVSKLIISKLKKDGFYKKNNIYRGLIANQNKFEKILKLGTDRELEGMVGSSNPLEKDSRLDHPSKIWGMKEEGLDEVVEIYANSVYHNGFSLILVYGSEFLQLDKGREYLYEFKKGSSPFDALGEIFKFKTVLK